MTDRTVSFLSYILLDFLSMPLLQFLRGQGEIFAWARKNKTTMDFPKYGSDYAQIFALFFCENMYNPLNVMSPLSINNS